MFSCSTQFRIGHETVSDRMNELFIHCCTPGILKSKWNDEWNFFSLGFQNNNKINGLMEISCLKFDIAPSQCFFYRLEFRFIKLCSNCCIMIFVILFV